MTAITYKYLLKPTSDQVRMFLMFSGHTRFVYNELLSRASKAKQCGVQMDLSPFGLNRLITNIKQEFPWLADSYTHCLQESAKNLSQAFNRFFAWCKNKSGRKHGYPKFKSKKSTPLSFGYKENVRIDGNTIKLPKIGWVRFVESQPQIGRIKTARIKQSPSGKWFVTIVCKRDFVPLPQIETVVGVDVGLRHFATLSTGEHISNPRWLRKNARKLARLQRLLARKAKGSSNRLKVKNKISRLTEKIVNRRKDFQHKLSRKLINENQVIGVESLSLNGLMKTSFAKSIADAGLGCFLEMLTYKTAWYGRLLVKADKFYPSSKTCHVCKKVNKELKLEERWVCGNCDSEHDRDFNAACNLRNVAQGYWETQNVCGVV